MANRTLEVEMTVSWKYRVKFDDEGEAFQRALEEYSTFIEKGGDESSMIEHCVYNVGLRRTRDVEGVGVVTVDGMDFTYQNFDPSGIEMLTDWEENAEFEVEEIRTCRFCGCTEDHACVTADGPCHWVDDTVCSHPDCIQKAKGNE